MNGPTGITMRAPCRKWTCIDVTGRAAGITSSTIDANGLMSAEHHARDVVG